MKMGFSTADFINEERFINRSILDRQIELGAKAIEVSVGRSSTARAELMLLPENFFSSFQNRFLHAPSEVNAKIIEELVVIQNKFNFDFINFHPDKMSTEIFQILADSGLPVCLENMDSRKLKYRSVEEIKQILDEYNFGMVLDINHCYSNGGNMELVTSFWNELNDRIRYFHLSGFVTLHEPLYKTKQDEMINFVEGTDRPVIIESMLNDTVEMEQEWKYILNNMIDL